MNKFLLTLENKLNVIVEPEIKNDNFALKLSYDETEAKKLNLTTEEIQKEINNLIN